MTPRSGTPAAKGPQVYVPVSRTLTLPGRRTAEEAVNERPACAAVAAPVGTRAGATASTAVARTVGILRMCPPDPGRVTSTAAYGVRNPVGLSGRRPLRRRAGRLGGIGYGGH